MVQKLKTDTAHFVVGLTGAFGTGKSTVAGLFRELGAHVVDADKLAHEALQKKSPIFRDIANLFRGKGCATKDGLDRKKIAAVIFKDAAKRRQLEGLVHPYVFQRVVDEITNASQKVVILEVPLLYETSFDQYCHKTIVVYASKNVIKVRLKKRGFSAQEVEARIKAQMPLEEKMKRADIVIKNDGSLRKTESDVKKVWKSLTQEPNF